MNKMKKLGVIVLIMVLVFTLAGCGQKATSEDTINTINAQVDQYVSNTDGAILEGEYLIDDEGNPYYIYVVDPLFLYATEGQMYEMGSLILTMTLDIHQDAVGDTKFSMGVGDEYGNLFVVKLLEDSSITVI